MEALEIATYSHVDCAYNDLCLLYTDYTPIELLKAARIPTAHAALPPGNGNLEEPHGTAPSEKGAGDGAHAVIGVSDVRSAQS